MCSPEMCFLHPDVWVLTAFLSIMATFAIAYPMAYADRNSNPNMVPLDKTCSSGVPDFFLSSSIAYPNGQLVGAFGLSISGMAMMMVLYLRYAYVKKKTSGPSTMNAPCPSWLCCGCNEASFWIGVVATIGIIGVGAFPCVQIESLHYLSAVTAFGLYNCYIVIQTFVIDRSLREVDAGHKWPPRHWLRCIFAVGAVASAFLMFALGFGKNEEGADKDQTMTSVFEIAQVAFFELWILTLWRSFKTSEGPGGEQLTIQLTLGSGLADTSKEVASEMSNNVAGNADDL